jgi:prevent-host-death family protein
MYNSRMELNISEVRQRLLALINAIPPEGVTITRHGEPVARLIPVSAPNREHKVTFPLIRAKGKPGPLAPSTENPHDLILP